MVDRSVVIVSRFEILIRVRVYDLQKDHAWISKFNEPSVASNLLR